jgi:hypothetical protein
MDHVSQRLLNQTLKAKMKKANDEMTEKSYEGKELEAYKAIKASMKNKHKVDVSNGTISDIRPATIMEAIKYSAK